VLNERCNFTALDATFDEQALTTTGVASEYLVEFDRCIFRIRRNVTLLKLEQYARIVNSIFVPVDSQSKGAFGHTQFRRENATLYVEQNTFYDSFIPLGTLNTMNLVVALSNVVVLTTVPDLTISDGTLFDNNLVNVPLTGNLADRVNFKGEPMFVDPTGGDFNLMTGSPAIDKGRKIDSVAAPYDHDFDGKPRPVGSASDLGAFEYRP
jgi:hypothetical protein